MPSLEDIYMPEDVGQAIDDSVDGQSAESQSVSATETEETSFDDLFEFEMDDSEASAVDSDMTDADEDSEAEAPVIETVELEQTESVDSVEEAADQVGELPVVTGQVESKEVTIDADQLGMAFNRVLALSKWIRELRVYLKSQQEEVKETKKSIEDAMERMLIITEELGMQVDGLDLPEVEDTADPAEPVEEKAKADPVAEEVAPETNEPEADAITPPGPNKRPKTVIITKDIRDGEVHIFSQGEIVEVADVSENEGNLWVYQGPADSSESVEIVAGEYEVDTWSELPSDPDDEWEDVPDDEAENEGGLTWEQCSCSKANVAAFLDIGIKEPSDLVGKTVEDLTKASGIGPKKAEKILAAVESSLEPE